MKVAWLLAAFIAIVTYTAQLTCSGVMFWVRDLKLKLDQLDVSKVTCLTQKKSLPQSLFLHIKAHYEVP